MFVIFMSNSSFIVIFYISIVYFNLSALPDSLSYIYTLIRQTVFDCSMILLCIGLAHGLILLYILQIRH